MRLRKSGKVQSYFCNQCQYRFVEPALSNGVSNKSIPEDILQQKHMDELKNSNERYEHLLREHVEREKTYEFIAGFHNRPLIVPQWLSPPKKSGTCDRAIATLFLSDTHFDEVIDPEQIGQMNCYNRKIARERLHKFFESACILIRSSFSGLIIDGVVIALGGDLLSGEIHSELRETNAFPLLETVYYWTQELASELEAFAKNIEVPLFIPSVVGNHTRRTHKPIAKNRVEDNFDWLIAKLLERHFDKNPQFSFSIPKSADCRYSVYHTRYLLTHGDAFFGGSGISGIMTPIALGNYRTQRREKGSRDGSYDVMIMGHHHHLMFLGDIIINGCLCGMDEFAYTRRFGFEPPQQAFWLTDPNWGITLSAPIHVAPKPEWTIEPSSFPSPFSTQKVDKT
jgi:hypothetical protein